MSNTSEFWQAVSNKPERKLPAAIIYKAYQTDGKVTSAMSGREDEVWPEDGIIITKELYNNTSLLYRCRLINGKLVEVRTQDSGKIQLEKTADADGKFTSLKNNIIFAAEEGDNYKQREYEFEISSNS